MKRGIKLGFRRKGRLFRSVAFLFLLFTALDITSSELCHERLEELLTSCPSISNYGEGQQNKEFTANDQTTPGQSDKHPDQEQHTDDCFCCCAHVLPVSVFSCRGRSELISLSIPLREASIPSAQLEGLFRPPRLS
jgi:hypothetical protein